MYKFQYEKATSLKDALELLEGRKAEEKLRWKVELLNF